LPATNSFRAGLLSQRLQPVLCLLQCRVLVVVLVHNDLVGLRSVLFVAGALVASPRLHLGIRAPLRVVVQDRDLQELLRGPLEVLLQPLAVRQFVLAALSTNRSSVRARRNARSTTSGSSGGTNKPVIPSSIHSSALDVQDCTGKEPMARASKNEVLTPSLMLSPIDILARP